MDFQVREGSRAITYREGQGSQILGDTVFKFLGYPDIDWIHQWEGLAKDSSSISDADSAVFVVIDPRDEKNLHAIELVTEAGFVLYDLDIGVRATRFPYLEPIKITPGYYLSERQTVPRADLSTYAVDSWLGAAPDLTERQKSAALVAFGLRQESSISAGAVLHSTGSSVMEDLATALGALVDLVVLLAALFGIEILLHRRYLHEMNNMISRISLLQAHHNLLGVRDRDEIRHSVLYLDGCADLLGIISTVVGYYGQENAALVFSGLTGQLHSRANELKINIRLKLLHSEWMTPEPTALS